MIIGFQSDVLARRRRTSAVSNIGMAMRYTHAMEDENAGQSKQSRKIRI